MDEKSPPPTEPKAPLPLEVVRLDADQETDLRDGTCRQPVPEGQMPYYRRKRWFSLTAVIAILLDQYTKWWVIQHVPLNSSLAPIPEFAHFFQLTHVANTGGTFGLFAGSNSLLIPFYILNALGIAFYNYRTPTTQISFRLALGLIFGGIIGNLVDRLRLGHVTDFADFDLTVWIDIPLADWYIFNLADLALVTGIILLLFVTWREPQIAAPSKTETT